MKFICLALLLASLALTSLAQASPDKQGAAQGSPAAQADERADERFKSMDSNHDGVVILEEFRNRFPNMTAEAFAAIDSNKDDKISLAEWRNFFQNHGMMGSGGKMHGQDQASPPAGHGPQQKPLIMPPPAK